MGDFQVGVLLGNERLLLNDSFTKILSVFSGNIKVVIYRYLPDVVQL